MSDIDTLAWGHSLLALALKSTLILGATLLLTILLRRRSAALRHWIWTVGLCSCLLLPLMMRVTPQWLPSSVRDSIVVEPLGDDLWRDPVGAAMQPAPASEMAEKDRTAAPQATTGPFEIDLRSGRRTLTTMALAKVIWFGAAAALILWFLVGAFRTHHLVRSGFTVVDSDWRRALSRAKQLLDFKRSVRLVESKRTPVPLAVGIVTATVVLPSGEDLWSEDERVQVLVHELAHLRRRDNLTQALAFLSASLLWFQPLAWLAYWRMKVYRELAADDAVLRSGEAAEDYGDNLIRVVRRLKTGSQPVAAAIATRGGLVGRIGHLLSAQRRNRVSPRLAAFSAVIATAAIAFLGTIGLNPTGAYALKAELGTERVYSRSPLFDPGQEGSSISAYSEALDRVALLKNMGANDWDVGAQTLEEWGTAPEVVRTWAASDEAQAIAELVVVGASKTEGAVPMKILSDNLDVGLENLKLHHRVIATGLAQAEQGNHMLAVRYLLALTRYMHDVGRGTGLIGVVYSAAFRMDPLRLVGELALYLTDEELLDTIERLERLESSDLSWRDTVRSEALFMLWVGPFTTGEEIEQLVRAVGAADSAPALLHVFETCSQEFICDGEMMDKYVLKWASARAAQIDTKVQLALELYRRRAGTPATKLADLYPKILPERPIDPRNGLPLSYRFSGGKATLKLPL